MAQQQLLYPQRQADEHQHQCEQPLKEAAVEVLREAIAGQHAERATQGQPSQQCQRRLGIGQVEQKAAAAESAPAAEAAPAQEAAPAE